MLLSPVASFLFQQMVPASSNLVEERSPQDGRKPNFTELSKKDMCPVAKLKGGRRAPCWARFLPRHWQFSRFAAAVNASCQLA